MFDVAPLVCVQSDAAMHRQDSVEVHVLPRSTRLLYNLLSCQKHPGGELVDGNSYATTSSRPMLVAAASHAALSRSGFRLFMESQVPDSTNE